MSGKRHQMSIIYHFFDDSFSLTVVMNGQVLHFYCLSSKAKVMNDEIQHFYWLSSKVLLSNNIKGHIHSKLSGNTLNSIPWQSIKFSGRKVYIYCVYTAQSAMHLNGGLHLI